MTNRNDTAFPEETLSEKSAREKEKALNVLRGAVIITKHNYERHPNSGAGNCWCGREEFNRLHKLDALAEKENNES